MTTEQRTRYSRHLKLPEIGESGQEKINAARVAVVGAGGLGCPLLQYLAAAGVGHIGIFDGDTIALSNLQRQVLYRPQDVGQSKALVAATLLREQNPLIEVTAFPEYLQRDTILSFLEDYDIVVDGSDNFDTRYLVNDACVILGKPLVFGSIYRFEGQVSVLNHRGGPTYRCLYPEPGELAACSEAGVLGVLPGITGTLMAAEVIKLCAGIGDPLSGRLLLFDALSMVFNVFSFSLRPENAAIDALPDTTYVCETDEIDPAALFPLEEDAVLIDVREVSEYEEENIGGKNIPLSELENRLTDIPRNVPVYVHCQSGVRSRTAVRLLQDHGFRNVVQVRGGLAAILRYGVL